MSHYLILHFIFEPDFNTGFLYEIWICPLRVIAPQLIFVYLFFIHQLQIKMWYSIAAPWLDYLDNFKIHVFHESDQFSLFYTFIYFQVSRFKTSEPGTCT